MKDGPCLGVLVTKGGHWGDLLVVKDRPSLGSVSVCGVHCTVYLDMCNDGAFLNSHPNRIIF